MDYCSRNTLEVWEEAEAIVIVDVVDRVRCRSIAVAVVAVVTGLDTDWKVEVFAERRKKYLSVVADTVVVLGRTPVAAAAATSTMTMVAVAEVATGVVAGVVDVAVERMMMSMLLNPERLLLQDIHHQDHYHRR
jgi:hypothetical protein